MHWNNIYFPLCIWMVRIVSTQEQSGSGEKILYAFFPLLPFLGQKALAKSACMVGVSGIFPHFILWQNSVTGHQKEMGHEMQRFLTR
jgi:hypothetical protein